MIGEDMMSNDQGLDPIVNVPSEQVGTVVQDFITFDGAKKVVVEMDQNGNFSVQAYLE